MSNQYYIQRIASGLLGNSPVWWAKGGSGYTSYIQNAEKFSLEDAAKLVMDYDKYAMWSCDEVNKRLHLVYDIQDKKNLGTDNPCGFNGVYATNPDAVKQLENQRDGLLEALKGVIEYVDRPPLRSCSCHVSPPCNDCVDWSHLREVLDYADKIIEKAEAA